MLIGRGGVRVIELKGVTKRYGDVLAVRDVSFRVEVGQILGFLGRNGAGKTTTLNIASGYIPLTEGQVLLDGHDILEEPRYVKRRIGCLPEQPPLYPDMTVDEYLRFACQIKEVEKRRIAAHVGELCELTGLTDHRGRLIRHLSKGYCQRVGLAQALAGNPEVLLLDEPTVGLDPSQIIGIRELIKTLGRDHAIVLSSHILTEVSDVCERVAIIGHGRILAQDTLSNLAGGLNDIRRVRLRALGRESEIEKVLGVLPGVRALEPMGVKEPDTADFILESSRTDDLRSAASMALTKAGHPVVMMRPMDMDLEDIFLRLTGEVDS
jgi:ABC-2 type transport system ATP-binding protein